MAILIPYFTVSQAAAILNGLITVLEASFGLAAVALLVYFTPATNTAVAWNVVGRTIHSSHWATFLSSDSGRNPKAVGSAVDGLAVGDRVVVPFNISCGHCWMCTRGLFAQCETTQVTAQGKGATLFGYTSLYGSVPGGQAEYLRVPQAHFGPVKVPEGPNDQRFLYLSDVLPTAWQAVAYADVPQGGSLPTFPISTPISAGRRIRARSTCAFRDGA